LHIAPRTATGSGTGSGIAIISQVLVYDSGRLYNDASTLYDGLSIATSRTASGSGVGSGTADWNLIRLITATGSGSGVGSGTADWNLIRLITATGSGTGTSSQTATPYFFKSRTASGLGIGSGIAFSGEILLRSATGIGVGSSVPGSWTKSLIFRPPVQDKFPWADYRKKTIDHELFGYVRQGNRARNVFLLKTGEFTNVDPLNPTLVDKVYYGGHDIWVTPDEKAVLVAAGFEVT
jgi:hypothetical protein